MERLTNFWGNLKKCIECAENSNCYSNQSCGHIAEAIAKLRDYEDLEEQGKLLKLPCAVGDTVYWVNDWFYDGKIWLNHENHITESKVSRFICDSEEIWIRLRNGEGIPVSEFNKTIFLTREEAEAALKGLEDKEE